MHAVINMKNINYWFLVVRNLRWTNSYRMNCFLMEWKKVAEILGFPYFQTKNILPFLGKVQEKTQNWYGKNQTHFVRFPTIC